LRSLAHFPFDVCSLSKNIYGCSFFFPLTQNTQCLYFRGFMTFHKVGGTAAGKGHAGRDKLKLYLRPVCSFLYYQISSSPCLFIYFLMALQPFVGPWSLFQISWCFYTVGRTPWTGISQLQGRYLIQDNTNRINARRHQSLKWDSNPRS
jgi:hypothetical protein